jgi:GWxTD domain-containing protein
MRKLAYLLIVTMLVAFGNHAHGKNLLAYLSYTTFNSPSEGPYIETYLSILGESIVFLQKDNGKFQGTVEVTIVFKKGEEIVNFDKYEINSPVVEDTSNLAFSFIDQQRYLLPNGKYEMEITIADKNGNERPFITSEPLVVHYPLDRISFSEIQLIESYHETQAPNIRSRGGYDFIPYVYNFFPQSVSNIMFYNEVYKTSIPFGDEGRFLISYYIEAFETGQALKEFHRNKRENVKDVVSVFGEFDITYLPSGNYNLVVEARDRENNLIAQQKIFLQRSNPFIEFSLDDLAAVETQNSFVQQYTDKDSLARFILYLDPICTEMERIFLTKHLKESDLGTMQQFFLNFWKTRNPAEPQLAWEEYLIEVNKVNASYSTPNRKGYDTDRGRVYLKYGAPNIISKSYNEPAAYPYEIWQYYSLGDSQRNKRFVFYTSDIITNDFILVHSDARGEVHNYRWQVMVYNRTFDPYNIDISDYPDAWGSKVHEYWDNPY